MFLCHIGISIRGERTRKGSFMTVYTCPLKVPLVLLSSLDACFFSSAKEQYYSSLSATLDSSPFYLDTHLEKSIHAYIHIVLFLLPWLHGTREPTSFKLRRWKSWRKLFCALTYWFWAMLLPYTICKGLRFLAKRENGIVISWFSNLIY